MKRATQLVDECLDVLRLDVGASPDLLEELLVGDHLTSPIQQAAKQLRGLAGQGGGLTCPGQTTSALIEPKRRKILHGPHQGPTGLKVLGEGLSLDVRLETRNWTKGTPDRPLVPCPRMD